MSRANGRMAGTPCGEEWARVRGGGAGAGEGELVSRAGGCAPWGDGRPPVFEARIVRAPVVRR